MEDLIEESSVRLLTKVICRKKEIRKISDTEYEVSGRIHLRSTHQILTGIELEYPEYKTLGFLTFGLESTQ